MFNYLMNIDRQYSMYIKTIDVRNIHPIQENLNNTLRIRIRYIRMFRTYCLNCSETIFITTFVLYSCKFSYQRLNHIPRSRNSICVAY